MYQYNASDREFLDERISQFIEQKNKYLDNQIDEDKFRNLRLRNGLYQEINAYMLRIAVPYGEVSSTQLRALAEITNKYDKGYAHITTRQNFQINWVKLEQSDAILKSLAKVDMHAIQTSGKLVRNITTDDFAGISKDEIVDPRPYCELIRQWFTNHNEFSYLAGKFKIMVSGNKTNNNLIKFFDLGLKLVIKNQKIGFVVYVGGGLGSYPVVAEKINNFILAEDILPYIESILRIYNLKGRRDNAKRNRIKFLVKTMGGEQFKKMVDEDFLCNQKIFGSENNNLYVGFDIKKRQQTKLKEIKKYFISPVKDLKSSPTPNIADATEIEYAMWIKNNVNANKTHGYSIVNISLVGNDQAPGDINSEQMLLLANLADKYSIGKLRTTTKQEIILPYVKNNNIYQLWQELNNINLAKPYRNTIAHITCCPGADYCSLAKTSSINAAKIIYQEFDDINKLLRIGNVKINISGCENSCAHHHIADIGLTGLVKNNKEYYQIILAGQSDENSVIGKKLGPSIAAEEVLTAIKAILELYLKHKLENARLSDVLERIGINKFKEVVYGT